MSQNRNQTVGAAGASPTESAPINVDFRIAWHIIEKGARVVPTYKITIETRQRIRISIEGEEVEIGYDGVTLSDGVDELIIDHRYNTALLRRNGELVAVSDKVRYHGVMSAADFVRQLKKSAEELIEGAVAEIASRA
jgi:hypothetical protein